MGTVEAKCQIPVKDRVKKEAEINHDVNETICARQKEKKRIFTDDLGVL